MIDRRHAVAALAALALQAAAASTAVVNQPAPNFTLQDAAGKTVSLADFKGKFVVLEWVNPGCPYVRKHYDSGNMPGTQKAAQAQGVVWLSVSSTATSSSDYKSGAELQSWLKSKGATPTAVLMDDSGLTGQAYGARTTPQMYIIDKAGKLIYAGAIDSKPTVRAEDVATAINYVKQGLGEALTGKPVSQAVTQPYGCSVKYAHG